MAEPVSNSSETLDIAVVGMAGRFPGAADVTQFWRNVCAGVESISFFSPAELAASGVDPALIRNPHYVPAAGVLEGADLFDAAFFGYYPREAEIIDPQQRVFLECAWEALENAGYDPAAYPGLIGVWAGCGANTYLLFNLLPNPRVAESVERYHLTIANDKDFLPTRVSYKLNLRGPSVNVQTACSTSLVSIHLACQGLLNYQCDMALAGGVSIRLPQKAGYLYQEGGIASPDGHCRAFDAKAQGTVGGNGAGILVLKRLADALADGDHIHACIKGSAINNDGSLKVGFTAPSVDGQAEVIAAAQAVAGVDPESIGYIEAHGTGTALGDPIEIAALTQAFGAKAASRRFCAIGSVKTNVGHLDAAAGVTGAIKAILAVEHGVLPPSLHFERPNPRIDFDHSPFYVNTALRPWANERGPRRAGVSSFGLGGTNAHLVIEEPPAAPRSGPSRDWQVLPLSAKTPAALDAAAARLAGRLKSEPGLNLADVAFTLQVGRQAFPHRRAVVCRDASEAIAALERSAPALAGTCEGAEPSVAFMFTGQGAQQVGMAAELYRSESAFREAVDRCAAILKPHLGLDLCDVIYPAGERTEEAARRLDETRFTQPALFAIEYALAQLWMKWGVRPQAMIGHSTGEYVAACLAGVFSLEDVLALVAERGRLMQALPAGAMLSVPLAAGAVMPLLNGDCSVAAENAPDLTVVSGPVHAIDSLEGRLAAQGIAARRLRTSHAFHSAMMEPILDAFRERVAAVERATPRIPFISNLTGAWITPQEAVDPAYWARHLRHTVRFASGVGELLQEPSRVLLEVGPGQTLLSLARRHPACTRERVALASLSRGGLPETLARLWLAGVRIDWQSLHAGQRRLRVALPPYPFERKRYWVDAGTPPHEAASKAAVRKRSDVATWFYVPSWRQCDLPLGASAGLAARRQKWLFIADAAGYAARLAARLEQSNQDVTTISGDHLAVPNNVAAFDNIVCCRGIDPGDDTGYSDFSYLVHLARELSKSRREVRIILLTSGAQEVTGEETLFPSKAIALGAARVIPQELPGITCQSIDVPPRPADALIERLLAEFAEAPRESSLACRGSHRWVQSVEQLPPGGLPAPTLRDRGVYLITGGLGRIGLVFARWLARRVRARLVLVDRLPLPASGPRAAAVRELESLGAEVLVFAADVAGEAAMRAVVETACRRFGGLNGVLHLAGVTEQGAVKAIQELSPADWDAQFRPKVLGSVVLSRVLADQNPDFCLLQSSLSSVLGGLGFAAYSGANLFMDLFARRQTRIGSFPWLSVNWDGWRFGDEPPAPAQALDLAMSPEEGELALERVLSLTGLSQIIISTADLPARMERWLRPSQPSPEAELGTGHQRPDLATGYVEPRTDLERAIVTEWRRVLGIERIGVEDDFFELGGHSLLGTQLVSRLRDRFQADLPLRRLFETPTVAGLAALIEEARARKAAPAGPALVPVPRGGDLPLSFAQQRLWFLDQLEPGSPLYNNSAAVRLTGPLDAAVLERSLNEIVRRHEVLRTVFRSEGGRPVQVILPELKLACPVVDLSGLTGAEQTAEISRLISEQGSQPFQLGSGPLLRFTLVRLGDTEHAGLLTMHHIISDGWSVGVLLNELAPIYEAFLRSEPSPLPELRIQYADFAAWQREWLRGETLEKQVAYWKDQLAGCPLHLDLTTDRPRPPLQSFRGATLYRSLPRPTAGALGALCRAEDVTPFMALLAAFQTLLCRYTGQEDIAVGTPIAGRNFAETEGLIGFFVNTLVMRTRLAGNPTFRELLARVRQVSLGAYSNQDLPFERLVEELQPERDLSRTPLVQVMFVLQNAPMQPRHLPGLAMRRLEVDSGTAKFDLTLFAEQDGDDLRLAFNYNTDLFDRATIERMAAHFDTLLGAAAADPSLRIWDLPLLSAAERSRVLETWNGVRTPELPFVPVARLFEEQARLTPGALALVCGNEKLTYAELDAEASKIAACLRSRGAGPETVVGLSLERSAQMIVALWGILKSGAAFLPLDPSYPDERLAFMRDDAGAGLVLTKETFAEAVGVPGPARFDPLPLFAENLAYIIYTSGSTGKPKGVLITQGALSRHARDVAAHFGLTSRDRELQFASLNFDAGLEQVIAPLITGATLYVRDELWSAREFHRKIIELGLTVVNVPPAYWQRWVEEVAASPSLGRPASLRLVIVGGDAMTPETLRLWAGSPLAGIRLLNAYGPTETTITAATYEALEGSLARVPIGRPLPNRTAPVLDRAGNPAPAGVPGELFLGGAGLARGYLNRPDVTAERFVPDPFSGTPGARLYRTGDLARYRPDGVIEFLGRIDQQVKIRGFRIELGEIEAVLAGQPEIRHCHVMAREDTPGDKRLVAYVVPQPGAAPLDEAGILARLKRQLPDFMLPSDVVLLDALPLTPGGKLDRRALPAPQSAARRDGSAWVAPRTPLETELASLWAEVLGVDRVGIYDNFFQLRGHSLLAAQLIARVRDAFQVELPLRSLFLEPTVAGMATAIAQCRAEQAAREDSARLEQLLAELDQLSDEEAQRLLSEDAR